MVVVDVSRNLLVHATVGVSGGAAHTRRLFTIIKRFEHSCVWAGLGKQEIVLEHTVVRAHARHYLRPIILHVLHEP